VALNPLEANHYLRTDFKIENLDAWMALRRGELLAAFLTIARGWIVAGRPGEKVRSDSYAEWLQALRGMLPQQCDPAYVLGDGGRGGRHA
jgi:hypothetical protein